MTGPCGNLGETKFASPIKLSRKKEVFGDEAALCISGEPERAAFRPMTAQVAIVGPIRVEVYSEARGKTLFRE